MKPKIILIAAVDQRLAIGQSGQLLWHCAQDQQHFKNPTSGHSVIMGRKTWDSLPLRFRPLPGRSNIVLSQDAAWQAQGAMSAHSFEYALDQVASNSNAYVIGGAQLYALALPWADELVLTEIETTFEAADAFFPIWDKTQFTVTQKQCHLDAQGRRFAFVTYCRRR
jgi:dihydrofolate reductase